MADTGNIFQVVLYRHLAVIEALRDFNEWIFSRLQQEYEWLMSDEAVDESIEANEYTFLEDGTRED